MKSIRATPTLKQSKLKNYVDVELTKKRVYISTAIFFKKKKKTVRKLNLDNPNIKGNTTLQQNS